MGTEITETEKKEQLSLFQKLLLIQKEVIGLKKDKKSNTYEYVTGNKVLDHIKPLMNEYGLLLKQEVLSIDNERQDYKTGIGTNYEKPKSEILSKVMMRFTWIDAETGEKDENLFGANGQNDWEKGLGSALTYAERYFLLKFFHIATDEDDIDNPERKKEDTTPVKQLTQPTQPAPVQTAKPVLLKDSDEWKKLIGFMESGALTRIGQVTKKFEVSDVLVEELSKLIEDAVNSRIVEEHIQNESPEKPVEAPKSTATRLPAIPADVFTTALKGTKIDILRILGAYRMSADQRAQLTEKTK